MPAAARSWSCNQTNQTNKAGPGDGRHWIAGPISCSGMGVYTLPLLANETNLYVFSLKVSGFEALSKSRSQKADVAGRALGSIKIFRSLDPTLPGDCFQVLLRVRWIHHFLFLCAFNMCF